MFKGCAEGSKSDRVSVGSVLPHRFSQFFQPLAGEVTAAVRIGRTEHVSWQALQGWQDGARREAGFLAAHSLRGIGCHIYKTMAVQETAAIRLLSRWQARRISSGDIVSGGAMRNASSQKRK